MLTLKSSRIIRILSSNFIMAKIRKHIIIKGRVQGVWFRATIQEHAMACGVRGWVKNTYSGNVEAVFEGDEEDVEKLIRWCRKGPRGAIVNEVKVKTEEYSGEYSTFSVKYSSW